MLKLVHGTQSRCLSGNQTKPNFKYFIFPKVILILSSFFLKIKVCLYFSLLFEVGKHDLHLHILYSKNTKNYKVIERFRLTYNILSLLFGDEINPFYFLLHYRINFNRYWTWFVLSLNTGFNWTGILIEANPWDHQLGLLRNRNGKDSR